MRHYKKGRKLGTDASHTAAIKKNLMCNLFLNDRIKTTLERAKEIRGDVDRVITWAKRGDVHARRLAIAKLGDKLLVGEIFSKVEQGLFKDRPGGYTRIYKVGKRRGDDAIIVLMELVQEPVQFKNKPAASEKDEAKGGLKVEKKTKKDKAKEDADTAAETDTEVAAEEASDAAEAAEAPEVAADEASEAPEAQAEEAPEATDTDADKVEEAPKEDAAKTEEAPEEDAPKDEKVPEEEAAEEVPAEETPESTVDSADEAPAEEAPSEEAPAEEAPNEDEPQK